jgi:hypothetical protein
MIYNLLALQLQRQLKALTYDLQLIGTAIAAPTKGIAIDIKSIS